MAPNDGRDFVERPPSHLHATWSTMESWWDSWLVLLGHQWGIEVTRRKPTSKRKKVALGHLKGREEDTGQATEDERDLKKGDKPKVKKNQPGTFMKTFNIFFKELGKKLYNRLLFFWCYNHSLDTTMQHLNAAMWKLLRVKETGQSRRLWHLTPALTHYHFININEVFTSWMQNS